MEGRKEMFNLTTHSTHFIYGCMALNIWSTTIQIVGEETHCHHLIGYSSISNKGSFICTISQMDSNTMTFVTPVMQHWLEQEIAQ